LDIDALRIVACGCALEKVCGLKENWSLINKLMHNTLENYNLAQMASSLESVDGIK